MPHGCCWARAAGRCGTPPPSTWPTSAAAARWRRCSSSTRRCSAGSTPCRARAAFSRPPPPVRPRPLALPLPLLLCSLGLLATAPPPAPERWLGCMSFPSGMTPDPTCPTHPRVQARSSWSRTCASARRSGSGVTTAANTTRAPATIQTATIRTRAPPRCDFHARRFVWAEGSVGAGGLGRETRTSADHAMVQVARAKARAKAKARSSSSKVVSRTTVVLTSSRNKVQPQQAPAEAHPL